MVAYDKATAKRNSKLGTGEVLERLRADLPGVVPFARIVGRWVWVVFETVPAADVRGSLSALGFHWNRKRSAWQHACGHWSGPAKGYDPRSKYGSRRIDDDD